MLKKYQRFKLNDQSTVQQGSSSDTTSLLSQNQHNFAKNKLYKKLLNISIIIVAILAIVTTVLYIKSLNTIYQNQLYKYQIGQMTSKQQRQIFKARLQNQLNKCQNQIIQIHKKTQKQLENYIQINDQKYLNESKSYQQKVSQENIQLISSIQQTDTNFIQHLVQQTNQTIKTINDKVKTCSKIMSQYQTDSYNTALLFRWQYPTVAPHKQFVAPGPMYLPKQQQISKLDPSKDFILVTPAGRRQYLQVLYLNLLKQHNFFYQWHIWLVTQIQEDIQYMYKLQRQNSWIKVIRLDDIKIGWWRKFNHFYRRDSQKNKVYLKLDDDTLYIDDNFVQTMWNHRFKLQQRMIIYPNIINNAMVTHIHQRAGVFQYPEPVMYNCLGNGWYNANISLTLHKNFIQSIQKNETQKWKTFKQWEINGYERFSINGFLYYSQTINSLFFQDQKSDEVVYAIFYPNFYKSAALVVGDAIMVHGAFFIQRNYFKVAFPQMVQKYKSLALRK